MVSRPLKSDYEPAHNFTIVCNFWVGGDEVPCLEDLGILGRHSYSSFIHSSFILVTKVLVVFSQLLADWRPDFHIFLGEKEGGTPPRPLDPGL